MDQGSLNQAFTEPASLTKNPGRSSPSGAAGPHQPATQLREGLGDAQHGQEGAPEAWVHSGPPPRWASARFAVPAWPGSVRPALPQMSLTLDSGLQPRSGPACPICLRGGWPLWRSGTPLRALAGSTGRWLVQLAPRLPPRLSGPGLSLGSALWRRRRRWLNASWRQWKAHDVAGLCRPRTPTFDAARPPHSLPEMELETA